ncbi:MAG: DUF305 domain-containing protein [Pseudomonas fluorescens]|nr:MAG: DUF305 domain-containing protein [Pseudomonas fluorescens]
MRFALALPLIALTVIYAGAVFAGEHDHTHHGHTANKSSQTETASTIALKQANDRMHKDMDITYSGDADVDFLRGMIAHHQGAVEMVEVQLTYGKDAQVKRLAQDIIRAQKIEIQWMQQWLSQLEKRPLHVSNTPTGSGEWTDKKWTGDKDVWFNAR